MSDLVVSKMKWRVQSQSGLSPQKNNFRSLYLVIAIHNIFSVAKWYNLKVTHDQGFPMALKRLDKIDFSIFVPWQNEPSHNVADRYKMPPIFFYLGGGGVGGGGGGGWSVTYF